MIMPSNASCSVCTKDFVVGCIREYPLICESCRGITTDEDLDKQFNEAYEELTIEDTKKTSLWGRAEQCPNCDHAKEEQCMCTYVPGNECHHCGYIDLKALAKTLIKNSISKARVKFWKANNNRKKPSKPAFKRSE